MSLDYTKKDAQIVKAGKKLVDELLSLNQNNRNPRQRHIEWLKEAINANEFILTGQGISVSAKGILIDGQHRLMAIRNANYPPVELLIVTGLDDKAKVYVDQHAKRSTSDMLKIVLNQEITTRMAAIINFHLKLKEKDEDFMLSSPKPLLDDIVDAMAEHSYILALILDAMGSLGRAGFICAIFHYAKKYDEDTALQFAHRVGIGEDLKQDDPAYRLRNYLFTRGKKNYGGSAQLEDYKIAVTACIAHACGDKLESLRVSHNWNKLPERHRMKAMRAEDIKTKRSVD